MKRTPQNLHFFDNLLRETIETLRENGKTPDDVHWVGAGDHWATWDGFAALADGFIYDSGWGAACVNAALVVVGDDWWLERSEYDGNERWDYKHLPSRPIGGQTISAVDIGDMAANDD